MDVSKDPRLLVAEEAVRRLERILAGWRLPWRLDKENTASLVREAKRIVYQLRYSYTPPRILASTGEVERLRDIAGGLAGQLLNPPPGAELALSQRLTLAEARWAINILGGLAARLRLGDEPKPEYGVDVVGVEVTRVEELGPSLYATRATTGRIVLSIVTNIRDIGEGQVRAAAILPPRLFGEVISEAMYSSGPIDKGLIGKRVPTSLLDTGLAGAVLAIVSGKS